MNKIHIIDSHTGGEPTRVIIGGGPELGNGSMEQRLEIFREQFDHYRSATVCEPRGSDVIVGALHCESSHPECISGVIFFNNVGYLGMCGHGMIGYIVTLAYLGKIQPGIHKVETPVGIVEAELNEDFSVTVRNVPSYRYQAAVRVEVPGEGVVTGDIAWGGNWFFLINDHGQDLSLKNTERLTEYAWKVRQALEAQGITGENGGLIDHIELFGQPQSAENHSKSFVLCPGKAYDRSPCGTGTSAKLACLAADGKLQEDSIWHQESILGSVFHASYRFTDAEKHKILPTLRGTAFVNADSQLILNERDPFIWGIR
jgi:4-hydroxyproline epimerase